MLQFYLNILSQTNVTHVSFINNTTPKLTQAVKVLYLYSYVYDKSSYLTVVSIGFTGKQIVVGLSGFLPLELLLQLK